MKAGRKPSFVFLLKRV